MRAPCPICGNRETIACAPGRDRLFGLARGTFSLLRCKSCACIYLDPIPSESVLAEYYPVEYWWAGDAAASGFLARVLHRFEKAYREFVIADHVRFLEFCARENGAGEKTLLDIGCGSGAFLQSAQSLGFIPHGMDPSARAVEVVRKHYGYPMQRGGVGQDVWGGRQFDFVTMFHVLEHLPDPRAGLTYAGSLLKPKGTLILQVPNVRSLQARLFGTRWYGIECPRHVINYSPKALALLLDEMGFEYHLVSRFSLRDNPASIASSLVPWLDPVGRKGRRPKSGPAVNGSLEIAYLGLFLLALPAAYLESALGFGGTLWAYARRRQ